MNIMLYIKQAFSALKANKLRSFLSTLWIIIWIMSFVIMLAIWEWAKNQILSSLSKDANIIRITKKYAEDWTNKKEAKDVMDLKILEEVPKKVPNIEKIWIKYNSISTATMVYNWNQLYNNIYPVTRDFFEIWEVKKILWTYFWEDDFKENRKIIIIWYKVVKRTFWDENPIWKRINIWWELFTVSWVLDEKDWEFDENIFMPLETAKKYFWKMEIWEAIAYAKDEKTYDKAKADLNYFLFKKSNVEEYSNVAFQLRTNKDWIKELEKSATWFTYFLMFIWWISLLVWGIWIMNIMLVSVTERTREIWIRKAIWATNFTIMLQFLIESIILTLVWSTLAILFSYWIIKFIWSIIPPEFWMMQNLTIDSKVLMIAIIVSVSMWIIFWLMPAYKAAKLKIINALHFE